MKQYKRIGHQKTYQAHQFCYEKIELSEDFPTDKPDEECFRELLERIEALAKIAYPWLFNEWVSETSYIVPGDEFGPAGKMASLPKDFVKTANITLTDAHRVNGKEKPLSPKDNYLLEINQCTNTESLKALRFLAKTLKVEADKKEVEKAYETKLAELTNKKTQDA
jgi:hypothetical protein